MKRKHPDVKFERLSRIPAFRTLSPKQLLLIGSLADEISLPEGTVLARQGRRPMEAIFVTKGRVTVHRDGITATVEGGLIGADALEHHAPHAETLVAAGPITALAFDLRSFGRMVDEFPGLLHTAQESAPGAVVTAPAPAFA